MSGPKSKAGKAPMTRFLLYGILTALTAVAQTPKPGGGGTPTPTSPTVSPSRTTIPQTQTQDPNLTSRTIFITGKVVMDDGTPPPEAVLIERICGSTRRAETRTDMKGHFSFQIGDGANNSEQIMDVSNDSVSGRMPGMNSSGGLGSGLGSGRLDSATNLRGCELRASLAGYHSSVVNLSMHSQFDSPDVGMIILKRLAGRDGDTISMTNALAPKDAKKAYEKSRQLLAKGNRAEAQKELAKAVDIYPKYASAWAELGRLQMEGNEPVPAKKSFEKALEADAKYLPPYERMAVLAMRDRNWDEVLDKTDKLIKLNGYDFPQAYYYNALANLNLGHPELAEKSARQALKQDSQKFARAGYVLGLALAQQGQFSPAAQQLKAYLAAGPTPNEVDGLKQQLADIEKRATEQTAAKEPE